MTGFSRWPVPSPIWTRHRRSRCDTSPRRSSTAPWIEVTGPAVSRKGYLLPKSGERMGRILKKGLTCDSRHGKVHLLVRIRNRPGAAMWLHSRLRRKPVPFPAPPALEVCFSPQQSGDSFCLRKSRYGQNNVVETHLGTAKSRLKLKPGDAPAPQSPLLLGGNPTEVAEKPNPASPTPRRFSLCAQI